MSAARRILATAILAALPVAEASAQVRFERTGYRFTSLGQQVRATARVAGDTRGPIRWRVADTSIARVNARGIIESRKAGYTRLWGVAGGDSSSALILVDQWAATFDFVPSVLRLHAVGDRAALRIQARDANGFPVAGVERRAAACRALNERIASLAANGQVTAHANGVTYIRCADRGVSDSVRVEVRQRVASATIVDKLGYTSRVVGDTFRIRLSAKDVSGGDIRDVQATWASLNPMVVSVDPLSGMARSVGPGVARIVAQVGDATDTVSVQVLPGAGFLPIALSDTGAAVPGDETRGPALHLQSLFLTVGDTARVTPRDAAGVAIANAEFRITSADSATVQTLSGQRVLAARTGSTYVIVQFGGLRDSLLVSVREKADAQVAAAGDAASAVAFVRPTFNLDSARAHNRRLLDSAAAEIRKQSVVAVYSGRKAALMLLVGQVTHATRDTNYLDKRSGMLYGVRGELAPHRRVWVSGTFRTGSLATTAASGEALNVTEAEVDVGVRPSSWFAASAGYMRRATETPLARQRWEFPRISGITRFDFVGGALTAVTGLSLLPATRYTGYLDAQQKQINPDPFSFAGETGLELHSGKLTVALMYYAERISFPRVDNNATARTDQFSALRLRAGYQLGR